jgi:putative hydrolase of the HAD superfamily
MRKEAPQALLFDLGGVLFEIDFDRALAAWASCSSLPRDALKREFGFDLQYQRHERGEIAAAEYFDHLASILRLRADHEEIEKGWNSIFVREITQVRIMVETMRRFLPCYALTNTNASHMATWSAQFPEVFRAFDRIFASHEMHLRKPERAAFDHICRVTGVEAASIVFFDDLPENVHAASEAGLQGVLVRSPDDVANSLRAFGYRL